VGIALDLGYVTHLVRERLRKSHVVILESNYDDRLLTAGPYPWALKQRLQGRHGHLSNKAASKLLSELVHSELKHVVLAHISQTNNHPKLAYKQAQAVLNEASDCGVQLSVAHQRQVGQVIELR
jgi:phosphoribosyl 1,2-cyclic phosphodiesterase